MPVSGPRFQNSSLLYNQAKSTPTSLGGTSICKQTCNFTLCDQTKTSSNLPEVAVQVCTEHIFLPRTLFNATVQVKWESKISAIMCSCQVPYVNTRSKSLPNKTSVDDMADCDDGNAANGTGRKILKARRSRGRVLRSLPLDESERQRMKKGSGPSGAGGDDPVVAGLQLADVKLHVSTSAVLQSTECSWNLGSVVEDMVVRLL